MDPISLISAALMAGVAAAAKDTASQAVTDAYSGLKALLATKLAGRPLVGSVIEEYERAPDIWQAPLNRRSAVRTRACT